MLAKRFLTPELRAELCNLRSQGGFTLDDIVRSGMKNPDSSIGVYAGDEDCYQKFAPLFDKIIEEYHRYPPDGIHRRNLSVSDLPPMSTLDPEECKIISTRIRVARNIKGFPFPAAVSSTDRLFIEKQIVTALARLRGDLSGTYYPLSQMDEDTRVKLTTDHFLFKKGDRFLEAAGINRNWPDGRGIFHSEDKNFLVWINEEDELRIISMQPGGDLKEVFERLVRGITAIEEILEFACSDHLGYLTSCPSNLGTAMRASVHVKLPKTGKKGDFKDICETRHLSARGIHGEHSEAEGGVWDISNKQRLGISEIDCITILYNGVMELLAMEQGRA